MLFRSIVRDMFGSCFLNGGCIKSNGSILSTNTLRLEIQSPKMEVDGLDVLLFIAKAAAPDFEALDAAIHTLRRPVVRLQQDGIENAPQMLLDDSCHLFDRGQATADGPGIPPSPPRGSDRSCAAPHPRGAF